MSHPVSKARKPPVCHGKRLPLTLFPSANLRGRHPGGERTCPSWVVVLYRKNRSLAAPRGPVSAHPANSPSLPPGGHFDAMALNQRNWLCWEVGACHRAIAVAWECGFAAELWHLLRSSRAVAGWRRRGGRCAAEGGRGPGRRCPRVLVGSVNGQGGARPPTCAHSAASFVFFCRFPRVW